MERLRGALVGIFFVVLALVLSLPVRVKRFLPALTRSVFFEDRLTNGPFCGYTLEREDSAERLLLSLPDLVNWLRLDCPACVLFED